ncbi:MULTISPECIES: hypothetical protein [Acetobacter]|uniref:hypothetical protein n=1 Tax=Acetobacter TaxID=434 RepID=UPI00209CA697|nr:hypothetical protein [Acetobacter lovaniensis]MCP1239219.1 hypothetical protein [Acetobacter lovaniensis]
MCKIYPPRIKNFRDFLIKELPRVPNNKASRAILQEKPTSKLILYYLTWQMRFIPAKPRQITFWSGGITPSELLTARTGFTEFIQKVATGQDLTPHLSNLVRTKGIVMPDASISEKGKDLDKVLIRHGLHHFHIGEMNAQNPMGRSGTLVFAEVFEKEFRIIAIADHKAFMIDTKEHKKFSSICYSYLSSQSSQGFLTNPIMSSGHSYMISMYAKQCQKYIENKDAHLDENGFIDRLFKGHPVQKPSKPDLRWYFNDLNLGILEYRSRSFFCAHSYFNR